MTGWLPLGLLLVAYGLAYILGESAILTYARLGLLSRLRSQWTVTLVYCPACLGWWTGLVVAVGAVELGFAHDWRSVLWLPFGSMVVGQVRSMLPYGMARDIEFQALDVGNPWLSDTSEAPASESD